MLDEHLNYVSDPVRLEAYYAAVKAEVRPGFVVADLGCGTGVLGMFCLEAGASRVFEIDSSAMLDVAMESFSRAGLGDRCVYVRGRIERAELSEPVDMLICDQVGYFGFDYGIIHAVQAARRRFLKPGGKVLPRRLRLKLGAVDSDRLRQKLEAWKDPVVPVPYHWIGELARNTKTPVELTAGEVISSAADLADIDLTGENPEFFSWETELTADRDGMLDGIAGWFECEIANDIWMTNSPLAQTRIQRPQAFFPLMEAIRINAGAVIKVTVMARPADRLITWSVDVPNIGYTASQSSWAGAPISNEALIQRASHKIPLPTREGRARMIVMKYCDGKRTIADIKNAVLADHPDLMPSATDTFAFIDQVLGQDTA